MNKPCLCLTLLCTVMLLQHSADAGHFYRDDDDYFKSLFRETGPGADAGAGAIILYEKHSVLRKWDLKKGMYLANEVHRVIRILDKSKLDLANIELTASSTPGIPGEFTGISCTTYNMEGGKLVRHKLNASDVLKTNMKYQVQAKFSAPAVQVGSIIDYHYRTIESSYSILLADWDFQNKYPKRYSELEVLLPSDMEAMVINNRNPPFKMFNDEQKGVHVADLPQAYHCISPLANGSYRQFRWVRRNVPPIHEEPYMASIDNYKANIRVSIAALKSRYGTLRVDDTWEELNKSLLKDEDFYELLKKRMPEVKAKAAELTRDKVAPMDKARAIYRFVRDTMKQINYGYIYAFKNPETVLKDRTGSTSEVNFLLIRLLREAGLQCEPVISSTRNGAHPTKSVPILHEFNRTVAELTVDSRKYYLDASWKYNAFGSMPTSCYNGYSWRVDDKGGPVDLSPEMLEERSIITVTTEKADLQDYRLRFSQSFGHIKGASYRSRWITDSSQIKTFAGEIVRHLPMDAKLAGYEVRQLSNPDSTLELVFTVAMKWPEEAQVYLNPVMATVFEEHPFKSGKRVFPVEMPYAMDCRYSLQLQLPAGFVLEEGPASTNFEFDDKDTYQYRFSYDKDKRLIRLGTELRMKRTQFPTDDYSWLQEFFNTIIQSQQNNIIIKKQA